MFDSYCGSKPTASKFDLARLVVHGIVAEDHVARECESESLTVEDCTVWRQTDETVRYGDGVENAGFEVTNEHVGRPETVELAVVECDTAVSTRIEHQSVVLPDLSEIQRHRKLLSHHIVKSTRCHWMPCSSIIRSLIGS